MAAASLLQLFFFLISLSVLFSSILVHCDEDDELLQGLNSYRTARNLPALAKNNKAECLAEELAEELEHQPCSSSSSSQQLQVGDYPRVLKKCKININYTSEGVVMEVCVPNRVPTLVLTNFTQSRSYSRYLNDSKFTGVGIGSEDDWVVAVLATDAPEGSFSSAAPAASSSRAAALGFLAVVMMMITPCWVALCFGLFAAIINHD